MTFYRACAAALTCAAVLMIGACSTRSPTRLSDGTVAYRIDCEGTASGLNYCFGKAGKSCGADGFTILDETGKAIGSSDVANGDTQSSIMLYAADKNSILIKCGT